MDRIDKILVELGHVKTRSAAKQLIEQGKVTYLGKAVTKTGLKVEREGIEVEEVFPYVGRGALKLKKAHEFFDLRFEGKVIADVGASTGGFTDYSLQHGAIKSYAIDVGHDQLAEELRSDSRVINMEKVNIRHGVDLPEKVDLCVVDLSFISLTMTLEEIFKLSKETGEIVCLVKPQFEAGKERVGKNGIVRDEQVCVDVLYELYDWCLERGMKVSGACLSPITGKQGNREFLFYFNRESEQLYPRADFEQLGRGRE